jgi:transposase
MGKHYSPEIKQKALSLKTQGLQQKQIAEIINVSEKTICDWVKNSPQIKAQKALTALQIRLYKEAYTLTLDEVAKLTDSISKLHKIAYS